MAVRRGDMVVSTLPNGPERVLCDVGINMAPAVMVNAQCQLADGSDLLLVLRQSKACAVCVNPDLTWGPWNVLKQHVKYDPLTHTITSTTLPHLRQVFFIRRTGPLCQNDGLGDQSHTGGDTQHNADSENGKEEMSLKDGFTSPDAGDFIAGLQRRDQFYQAEVRDEDTVSVFTTSGSTGFSKLAPNTHALIVKAYKSILRGNPNQFSMTFSCSPLGWLGGYIYMYLILGKGRALLDMWEGLPDGLAALVWDTIVQECCYEGVIMPFLLPQILDLEDRKAWKMKNILLAGQPINRQMVSQALQLSESILVLYASIELTLISALLVTEASQYQDNLVGKPLPCNTVQVCDGDGKEVPRGSKGNIYAKTAFMIGCYLNSPEETAASFTADGYLKTGDIGVMLEDGSLLVEGRHPDVIHRGNYIFYPSWLEDRIMNYCPGLQEVFVVGVSDPAMGQEICACFVPSDTSVTEEHVRSKVENAIMTQVEDPLSPRPRYYLSFQTFPRTYTDKPLRREVRRLAAERLNLA